MNIESRSNSNSDENSDEYDEFHQDLRPINIEE